jgi:hypothetical protein
MNDQSTQLWHYKQKRKTLLWRILSKVSQTKDALAQARQARENADYWDGQAHEKMSDLHHEVSSQYEEKEE